MARARRRLREDPREQAPLLDAIEAANAWEIDSQIEQAMDALRCPPPDEPVDPPVRWRATPGRAVQAAAGGARPAAARRAHQPPRRRVRGVAGEAPVPLRRRGAGRHPRPLLPGQRGAVDPRARPRPRLPVRGQLLDVPGEEAGAARVQGKKDAKLSKRLKDELEWVRQNAKGRQTKSKSRLARYEEMAAEAEKTRKLDFEEIQIPAGPRLGSVVIEAKGLRKGFGDRVLIEDLSFDLPRGGIVGIIGPNGVGKTTLFKTIVGLEQPDERRRARRRDRQAVLRRPGPRRPRPDEDGVGGRVGRPRLHPRRQPGDAVAAPTSARSASRAPTSRSRPGVLSGGERNRLNLAMTLKQGGNVLLLDEPTNDLDVETLRLAGERAARVPRLRGRHQPRPVVPRPRRHPHPGVGGHRGGPGAVVLVRGQLRVVREEQGRADGPGRRPPAPRDLPQAHPRLMRDRSRRRGWPSGVALRSAWSCSSRRAGTASRRSRSSTRSCTAGCSSPWR